MPDLHDWISQQIDEREALARRASRNGAAWTVDLPMRTIRADDDFAVAETSGPWAWHIAANDPAAVLRRCAADRKILEIHAYSGGVYEPYACTGCGHDDMGAWVEHANDCETLQALAEGYGLTDDERAQLDRPQPQSRQEASVRPAWDAWPMGVLQRTTPTSAVPAALRGPNWKARPTA